MAEKHRRVTIKDVAETAGVSRSTTSRALTGNGYVSPAVRDRVLDVAKKLGYVPDVLARSLKQQRSTLIGVLVYDLRNAFYADLAAGISARARERGFGMILSDTEGDEESAVSTAEALTAMRVAGVIITPGSPSSVSRLLGHGLDVVEVDRHFAPASADSVVVSNERGAGEATTHLLKLGHRRIALLIDETEWTTGDERRRGYLSAMQHHGLADDPSLIVRAGWDAEAARAAARELLCRPDRPTAVFAANNVLAEGVWNAAVDLELTIPRDLSLVAFDDAPWMRMVRPAVTTVTQDAFGLGMEAADRLFTRIEHPQTPYRSTVLNTRIEIRGSAAAPPAGH